MAPPRTANYALLGAGSVGRAFLEMVLASRDHHADRYGLWLNACVVADSSSALTAPSIADKAVAAAVEAKKAGKRLSEVDGASVVTRADGQAAADFLLALVRDLPRGTIVVDCTASEDTVPALKEAVASGLRVVSANKKPFSMDQATYDALVGAPQRHPHLCRHESTVGAGLPVIAALQRLQGANDPVRKVAGTFSGTLGYVMTGLQEGRPFSEIVADARAQGFTEPDPRDDLGGVDVARKALILARGMGMRLELSDVEVSPLYPKEMEGLSVEDFMAALPALDAEFAAKAEEAKAKGEALRYAAAIEGSTLKVGAASVKVGSPLGSLSGTDNLVEFYTKWYPESPLVIRGAGAGAGTTAAGILADVVELAFAAEP